MTLSKSCNTSSMTLLRACLGVYLRERDPIQSKGIGEYPVCGLDFSVEIQGRKRHMSVS
jgi:hypothetical protein